MSSRVYVDETKHRGYVLAAAVVVVGDLEPTRRLVRSLVLPGQSRVHMKDESSPRKRAIAAAIATSGIRATIYDAGRRHDNERGRRAACLRAVVVGSVARGSSVLVIEQDDTLLSWDNQQLIEITRELGCRDRLRYEHARAATEALLALPDAIAWCWAKGGDWRRRIGPVVTSVIEV